MKTDRNILMRTRVNPEHFHITRLMSSCCLYSIFTHVFTLQVSTILATVTKHRTGSQDDHWVPPTGVQWIQVEYLYHCFILQWTLDTGYLQLVTRHITPRQCPCKPQHQRAAVSACAVLMLQGDAVCCSVTVLTVSKCHQQSVSSIFSV